jgi:hypothetical protein
MTYAPNPPAPAAAITALRAAVPTLPNSHLAFLTAANGAEGNLGVEPGWFQLWPAQEVVSLNASYELAKYLPGFIAIGSNGGGELFVLFAPAGEASAVYMVPAIGMAANTIILVAPSFGEFAAAFGKELVTNA